MHIQCRSPTALKRPDRSKQCHCLQFERFCLALIKSYRQEEAGRKQRHYLQVAGLSK